jgi:hypothetical protein
VPAYWQTAEMLAARIRHGPGKSRFSPLSASSNRPFTCLCFAGSMKTQGLEYYMHDEPTAFRFELAGNLNHEGARRLDQDWRTASSALGDRRLIVDMTFVIGVDEHGHALITRWHREGAWLITNSKASRALAKEILGEALPETPPNVRDASVSDRARVAFGASFLARAVATRVP